MEVTGPRIVAIGLGTCGCNALHSIFAAGMANVELILVSDAEDIQRSSKSLVFMRMSVDNLVALPTLRAIVAQSDLVFVIAGLGGTSGANLAPLLAHAAREAGALTLGLVTLPFSFEGQARRLLAEQQCAELSQHVDGCIALSCDGLITQVDNNSSVQELFNKISATLGETVHALTDIVVTPALINLDLADLRSIFSGPGYAQLSIGCGRGADRSRSAAEQAVSSPMLKRSVESAIGIFFIITAGPDLSLYEVNQAAQSIRVAAHPNTRVLFGTQYYAKDSDELTMTLFAIGWAGPSSSNRDLRPPKPPNPAGDSFDTISSPSTPFNPPLLRQRKNALKTDL